MNFFVTGAGVTTGRKAVNSSSEADSLWVGEGFGAFLSLRISEDALRASFLDIDLTNKYSVALPNIEQPRYPTAQPTVFVMESFLPEPDPGSFASERPSHRFDRYSVMAGAALRGFFNLNPVILLVLGAFTWLVAIYGFCSLPHLSLLSENRAVDSERDLGVSNHRDGVRGLRNEAAVQEGTSFAIFQKDIVDKRPGLYAGSRHGL